MKLDDIIQQPGQMERMQQETVLSRINVARPGLVMKYDEDEMTVDVQLAVRGLGEDELPPVLKGVPVVFIGSFTFNVQRGDECLVVFADGNADAWWQTGNVANPLTGRKHDLSDGFALVGVHSKPNTTGWTKLEDVVGDISKKADKVTGATEGDLAGLDATGNLTDSGKKASDFADRVSGATSGNFAGLDASGNLTDSGNKSSDFRSNSAPASGSWFRGTPLIQTDGVMEIGKYIDFHDSNTTTADYSARITASSTGLTLSGTTTGTFSGDLSGTATKATQDGSGNTITSTYLPYKTSGGIASCSGGGSNWYFRIATITITSTYCNRPIVFEISQRGYIFSHVQIIFANVNSVDPGLGTFATDGPLVYYIKKTATSKWEVYGKYSEKWGSACLHRITGTGADISIAVNMANIGETQPSDVTTVGYYINNGISNITRSGTTFTVTRCDGSTFTFTQQDNNTTYNFSGSSFISGNSGTSEHNANNIATNGTYYYTSNGPATSLGATTADGAIYAQAYSTNWVGQIAQDYRNGHLFVRGKNNGTWQQWLEIPSSVSTTSSANSSGAISATVVNGTALVQMNNELYSVDIDTSTNKIFVTELSDDMYASGTGSCFISGMKLSISGSTLTVVNTNSNARHLKIYT